MTVKRWVNFLAHPVQNLLSTQPVIILMTSFTKFENYMQHIGLAII